jgi:lipopolysaccharide export system permease protein
VARHQGDTLKILDRYVVGQFLRIFGICVLGVPLLFIVIDLVDNLDTFLAQGATRTEVALHYVYQYPYQSLVGFPIAALLASVFTISSMTRRFETTAIKAGGISFYRMTAPIVLAGIVLSGIALALTDLVPVTNRRSEEVLGEEETRSQTLRLTFVYRANEGRVYKVRRLDTRDLRMSDVQVEREGTGPAYPTYNITASGAHLDTLSSRWVLEHGHLRRFLDSTNTRTYGFRELWQRAFDETPEELRAEPKEPDEMRFAELGRFINAIQRSGGTARDLETAREMRIAFPIACFIIVLFGTPLAHSSRRGGAPMSVAIALATTIFFMILIRISEALGAGGALPPVAAAWAPNVLFLLAGLALYGRVRT